MAELRAIRRFLLLGSSWAIPRWPSAWATGARGALSGRAHPAGPRPQPRRRRSRRRCAATMPAARAGCMPPVTARHMAPEPLRASPVPRHAARAARRTALAEPAAAPHPQKSWPSWPACAAAADPSRNWSNRDWPSRLGCHPCRSEDRIKARISDVIRTRVQRAPDPDAPPPPPRGSSRRSCARAARPS